MICIFAVSLLKYSNTILFKWQIHPRTYILKTITVDFGKCWQTVDDGNQFEALGFVP